MSLSHFRPWRTSEAVLEKASFVLEEEQNVNLLSDKNPQYLLNSCNWTLRQTSLGLNCSFLQLVKLHVLSDICDILSHIIIVTAWKEEDSENRKAVKNSYRNNLFLEDSGMHFAETIKSFPWGSWYFPMALKNTYIHWIMLAGTAEGSWVHSLSEGHFTCASSEWWCKLFLESGGCTNTQLIFFLSL